MSLFLMIVAAVCSTLIVSMAIDRALHTRVGWQDVLWRFTLVTVLVLPTFVIAGRACWPNGLIRIPVFAANSGEQSPKVLDAESKPNGSIRRIDFDAHIKSVPTLAQPQSNQVATNAAELPAKSVQQVLPAILEEPVTAPMDLFWMQVGILIWLSGSFFMLARLIWGWIQIHRIAQQATTCIPTSWSNAIISAAETAGLSEIQVRISDRITTPMVAGILHPVVLLPQTMRQLSGTDLRVQAAVSHEAMHIQRRDSLWNLLLCICLFIWWPIPMVYRMKTRMFWLREILCDAKAALHVGPADYAESLLQLTQVIHPNSRNAFALSMAMRTGSLEPRVSWILNPSSPITTPSPFKKAMIAISLIAALFVMFSVKLIPTTVLPPRLEPRNPPASPLPVAQAHKSDHRCVGTVKTEDGEAISGATVYLLKLKSGSRRLPVHPLSVKADASGNYVFSDVAPGTYSIWAEGNGLTSLTKFLRGARIDIKQDQDAPASRNIVLKQGCDYRVKVLSAETHQPIKGARIHFGWTDIEREYTTGADGLASIRGLASNDWYFVVKADRYATFFKKTAVQDLGSTTELTFKLKRGANVELELLDQHGDPVSDAIVNINYDDIAMHPHLIPYPSRTDANGKLRAPGMPLNTKLSVYINKDFYRFGWPKLELDGDQEWEKIRLTGEKLPYGGDIEIEVTDEEGIPIAGAVATNYGNHSDRFRKSKTDAHGRAVLKNLYSGYKKKTVMIKHRGKIPQQVEVEPGPRGAPVTIRVTLKQGRILKGILLTPDGKPAPKNTWVFYDGGEHGLHNNGGRVLTDAEGKFEITGLAETATLTVYTPQQYEPIEKLKIQLAKNRATIHVIEMVPAAVIRVRAVDDTTGDPIPKFNVRLSYVAREHRQPEDSDFAGIDPLLINPGSNIHGAKKVFRLGHQVAGRAYKTIVSAEGYETQTVERLVAVVESESEISDVRLTKIQP